jgi:hypothetical protein
MTGLAHDDLTMPMSGYTFLADHRTVSQDQEFDILLKLFFASSTRQVTGLVDPAFR